MTKPNYLVRVQWKEECSCLGEQLKEILEFIELYPTMKEVIWYASDLDSSPIPECIRKFGDFIPKKVGNTRDLITICQHVPQFLSGVFLAFSKDVGEQLDEGFETEADLFRDMGDAVLEIRAFDTSYFEIYSDDISIISGIANEFYGIPEFNKTKPGIFYFISSVKNSAKNLTHILMNKKTNDNKKILQRKEKWTHFITICKERNMWHHMSNANFLVRVTDKDFACLGAQLAKIIEQIHPFIKDATWYGANVTSNEIAPIRLDLHNVLAKRIGSTNDMLVFAREVDQFYSGVFYAFPDNKGLSLPPEYKTCETDFRDMRDALLEIRAVDTSYFEIYTNNYDLIREISRCFCGINEYNLNKPQRTLS
jgi:hypothetical protein